MPTVDNEFILMDDNARPQTTVIVEEYLDDHVIRKCLTWFLNRAAVDEWYRYRIMAGFDTSSSRVPLKTHRVGQQCMLNLSRA
ncbi:hypothetical protein TNCV_125961 [Trichonephila clavipes]|nr:hypothetical protein TNCV_125961 [Trichonephila clavipes]